MKITALLFAFAYAVNARQSERKQKIERIENKLDDTVEMLEDIQDFIRDDIKPDVEHYQISGEDLQKTIEETEWEKIESWEDFKDVDWDLI